MAHHDFSYILRISLIVFLFEIKGILDWYGPLLRDDMGRVRNFR